MAVDIGACVQDVVFENPDGPPVANGDGGYTQAYAPLIPEGADPPIWWMAIEPAAARDLERIFAGTVIATATAIARGHFLPGVTTQTRMRWTDVRGAVHLASVTGVANPDQRGVEMVLAIIEVVP